MCRSRRRYGLGSRSSRTAATSRSASPATLPRTQTSMCWLAASRMVSANSGTPPSANGPQPRRRQARRRRRLARRRGRQARPALIWSAAVGRARRRPAPRRSAPAGRPRRRPARKRSAPATIGDMAADTVGLLDGLGLNDVHLVGASMGGFIAQTVALKHPGRVRKLTLIMTSTGSRLVGQPKPRIYPRLLRRRAAADRPAAVAATVEIFRLIGSRGFPFDERYLRELA